ncbi:TatD family hydrolase [Blastopirellula sp. JC732]|uniref:TatD family hydrolase n=1 Tax=Blastopirellula sediminis TaxID=2894196 RepID=A0A9X1SGT4_9BACT|nr:TatD family hydrolase [Blastopirellula sediminis]MCC9607656.1 TatD family hydrolase [Blastopirellula sediminis]MCC9629051.1 TatD family hydrolase [Blastopirellula sediminis]
MNLFDTHAHLFDETLISQIDDVVARARAANVSRMLVVGTTAEDSAKAIEIAERFPEIFATVGIQPNYCGEVQPGDWERIVEMLEHPKVVALGETGLDRYWDNAPFDVQQDYFDRHLRLSQERDFPFIVHMRDCGDDIVVMLEEAAKRGPLRGVMHSFTGEPALLQQCLDLDMYISFAGMVTFKKSGDLREVATMVPKDRILIETDSPYLSPEPVRGKRPNEPAYVAHTAACVAAARGESLAEFANLTTENAYRLFRRVGRD